SVYADPDYGYVLLPPVELPPNQLLRETYPHSMDFVLYASKYSGGSSTLDVDQILLLPLAQGANFLGFSYMYENNILIDDSFRGLHNVHYSLSGSELVAHIRQGGPLRFFPRVFNRLFFIMVNQNNDIDIMRAAVLQVFQRETRRVL
ncbi:MAG: hypothetical protein SVP52_09015, partial [Chloroflexota bacterium]|nr:hypothetical protein [Chloroflexota bacterium]